MLEMEDEHIYKRHNKTLLLYHLVFPTKFRKKVLAIKEADETLKNVCIEISERYEIKFIEIGTDNDHFHFLIQSAPTYSVTKLVTTIKSITAREIFKTCPQIKKQLWGGEFWTSGYYANTVGQYGNRKVIEKYIKNQGKIYNKLHQEQLTLF